MAWGLRCSKKKKSYDHLLIVLDELEALAQGQGILKGDAASGEVRNLAHVPLVGTQELLERPSLLLDADLAVDLRKLH